ncbi:DUF2142 domain-containing protein [Cellulomonas iranensis]|uniref:DUF2142 domain-containing protein n=1 Tax=Cellulomonas iranensis TaxID=76862 RepID=UPI003D7D7A25
MWVPASLCALVLLLGLVLALSARVGAAQGADTQHFAVTEADYEITPRSPWSVDLTATEDGLSQVGVVLGTWTGDADCTLTATLAEGERVLASQDKACDQLADTLLTPVVEVEPIEDSEGRTYRLSVTVSEDSLRGPAVWKTIDGTPAVVALYGETDRPMLSVVDEVLERVAVYAPAWGSPAALVILVVLLLACVALVATRPRWGLVTLLVLVLARGLLWSVLVPPLQGMDEPAHFANVQFIAEEGRLPNWNTEDRRFGAYSPSLEVAAHAMSVSSYHPTDRPDYGPDAAEELREADAAVGTDSDGTGPAASYPPPYYAIGALFYQLAPDDTVAQVHAIRLWSTLLGVAAIVFAWLFAGEVLPGRRTARAGLVTAIALQPMLAHQFALVNNDGWVIAAGFAALWIGARLVRTARGPWWMLAAGAVAGAAALGKPFAALMVIPIALGWFLGKIRYRVRDWRVLLIEPLLAAVGVALTYGVWLVAARVLGIDTGLGFPQGAPDGPRGVLDYVRTQVSTDLAEFRQLWVDQMWGNFGWVNTPLPFGAQQVIWASYLLLAVATITWLVLLVRDRRRGVVDEEVRGIDRMVALCVLSGLGALLGMYVVEYGYFRSTGLTNLLQGRYLLMIVPALLALPPLLAERLSRRRPAAAVAAWVVAVGVLALHVTSVLVIAQKYYL